MIASHNRPDCHVGLSAALLALLVLGACTLLADFPDYNGNNGNNGNNSSTCGNDRAESGEQCDGPDLAGHTCESVDHYSGMLVCTSSCQLDLSGCGGRCGDGVRQTPWEACDGEDFSGRTCADEVSGSTEGSLACASDCTIDAAGCYFCGDNVIDPGEDCDGGNLNGWDCEVFGLSNGELHCTGQCNWDLGNCGICGDDVCRPSVGETVVDCPADCGWSAIAAGGIATCGLRGNGALWCWGSGSAVGPTMQTFNPVEMSYSGRFDQLVAGREHFCALTTAGDVFCWGSGTMGQLGTGSNADQLDPAAVDLDGQRAVALAAGEDHSCAVLDDGSMWCWGSNIEGCLGTGQSEASLGQSNEPKLVIGVFDASAVAAGNEHTCALRGGGGVLCWGQGGGGELGDGQGQSSLTPVAVSGVADAMALTAGTGFTCVLGSTGFVRCWGANNLGQLGDGTTDMALEPVDATNLPSPMVQIDAGWDHACAVGTDTVTYCWGDGYRGRLGQSHVTTICTNNLTAQPMAPVIKANAGPVIDMIRVSGGRDHSCALEVGGIAWCWGFSVDGQLGIGQTAPECHSEAEVVLDL